MVAAAAAKSKRPRICHDKGVDDLLQRLYSGCRCVRFDDVDGGNGARLRNLAPPNETRAEFRRALTRACAGAPCSAPSGGTSPGVAPSGADVSAALGVVGAGERSVRVPSRVEFAVDRGHRGADPLRVSEVSDPRLRGCRRGRWCDVRRARRPLVAADLRVRAERERDGGGSPRRAPAPGARSAPGLLDSAAQRCRGPCSLEVCWWRWGLSCGAGRCARRGVRVRGEGAERTAAAEGPAWSARRGARQERGRAPDGGRDARAGRG